MEVIPLSSDFYIDSHKGSYAVKFSPFNSLKEYPLNSSSDLIVIDRNLLKLYPDRFSEIEDFRYLPIDASEKNKSLDKFPRYIQKLVDLNFKRNQKLIAFGGGIIQDITCFIASTIMRGVDWEFHPTTLLAQADSCIGSKSSINSGNIKNILGTFYPPKKINIDIGFLSSLEEKDVLSGIGEMIKVHAIAGKKSLKSISNSYENLFSNKAIMESFIMDSLKIKKNIIEQDEFDTGVRNVMNYGHSFGHAIESATNFYIPHGIAVTIGMDLANFVAFKLNRITESDFFEANKLLKKNYKLFLHTKISSSELITALEKDKKNTSDELRLILPNEHGDIEISSQRKGSVINNSIEKYLKEIFVIQ
jgi:3-dehydroquinate synthase